ncbi:MAG: Fic family protein [Candidatus Peregrinibacteria bacterium]|nr:Fic family protein [Candidatus Peregrinibacteria bacterium]MDZ4245332.1 Fic family protein [Candidatus Gracilibacteria bacterium]
MKKSTLITSSGASTRIEGADLSDTDVKKLLSGLKIQKLHDRSQCEVAGYAELTKLIFDHHSAIKWNENEIKHLHKILLKYSEKDSHHRGKYKVGSNAVIARDSMGNETVIFNPTPPYLIPKEMSELTDFTIQNLKSGEFHPLIIIGNFVCEFLAIHPFQDGNGRLSRALTNLLLLQNGYSYIQYISLEKIIEERKIAYYISLRESQKKRENREHNIEPWIGFFLDTLIEQTVRAKAVLQRKDIENELSGNQTIVFELLKSSSHPVSVKEIVEKTRINRNTVKKVLLRLRELKVAKQIGLGRGGRWSNGS